MDNLKSHIHHLRTDYISRALSETDVDSNPILQLEQWLSEAIEAEVLEANAMMVATVDGSGQPSARVVLLRELTQSGLAFYTNYESRKGQDLLNNPKVSATFFWPELERQVRIEGECFRMTEEESDAYFSSRPAGSRLGAWASPQSQELPNRASLDDRYSEIEKKFQGKEITRPPFWGGYRIAPHHIEFWQGRASRLHDRIRFQRDQEGWTVSRLAP